MCHSCNGKSVTKVYYDCPGSITTDDNETLCLPVCYFFVVKHPSQQIFIHVRMELPLSRY